MGLLGGSWNSNRAMVGKEERKSKDVWKVNWPEYLIGKVNRKDTVDKRDLLSKWWNYERGALSESLRFQKPVCVQYLMMRLVMKNGYLAGGRS